MPCEDDNVAAISSAVIVSVIIFINALRSNQPRRGNSMIHPECFQLRILSLEAYSKVIGYAFVAVVQSSDSLSAWSFSQTFAALASRRVES
jgi:hypothetical protein